MDHFGRISQLYSIPRALCDTLYLVPTRRLIGACNPMLCPIHVLRALAANFPPAFLSFHIYEPPNSIVPVRQLRHYFGTISHVFISPMPPLARCVTYYAWCPCLRGAGWGLKSDGMANPRLQGLDSQNLVAATATIEAIRGADQASRRRDTAARKQTTRRRLTTARTVLHSGTRGQRGLLVRTASCPLSE